MGTNYSVRNYGVSGRTLLKKGDFPYWKETAYQQSLAWNPDVVTIMLGTNDSKPQNWRYGTNFIGDYTALVASYANLASHPRILLFTPCPVFAPGAYDINPGIVATNILPMVRQLGQDLGLEIIDINTPMAKHPEWFPDTVHPNSKGSSILAAVDFATLVGTTNAAPPALAVQLVSPTRVLLSWAPGYGNWVAQAAPNFGAITTAWTVVESVATNAGPALHIGVGITGSSKYFRLWNPLP